MDYRSIYETRAEQYQRLVAAEDVDGNLIRSLAELLCLPGTHLVEIGAGTGRVTRLLGGAGARITATEPAAAMITVAAQLTPDDFAVAFSRAEAQNLPFRASSFDAAVAGWVFAHQREWSPDDWKSVVTGFVEETRRVVAPGGPIVLIETLGTGFEEPNPPADLVEYYHWLESSLGFERTWIRTDYEFATVAEAAEVTGGFFGSEFGATVTENSWRRIPECTGIWIGR